MHQIALLTTQEALALDEDLPPLADALQQAGMQAHVVPWDEARDWSQFDMLLLRSTWDYMTRLDEFLAWAEQASRVTVLANSAPTVRWNIDKHYLGALAVGGIHTIPTTYLEPGADVSARLRRFLESSSCKEFVIKPAIGVGSRDAQRHDRHAVTAAEAHAARLLGAGRSALLQPYLSRVDEEGEAALVFFAGEFSHSIRKGALLQPGGASTNALFAPETITAREVLPDELLLARRALAAVPFEMPLYARVDLIRDGEGRPCLLELEMIEPSLFFAHAPGAAARFAASIRGFVTGVSL